METWWKSVWDFTWTHGIQFSHKDKVLPKPQRIGNAFITEKLCSLAALSQKELISCNRCRLYLESITLANIVSGSGKRITNDATSLQPVLTARPSTWIWLREHPSNKDADAWR
jgi:hypothetical protein